MTSSRESPAANQTSPNHSSPERDRADSAPPFTPWILVVDDEPFIVDLLALALQDEGYQVACAYDGEQAWRLVHEHRPDLIISDVSMPRLDGLDLLRRLRQRQVLSHIPVILMSAARRSIDLPDTVFVPKPFDLDRMLALVEAELTVA